MLTRFLIPVLFTLLASGCNIVYKQDIQQGNVLDKEDVEELRTGMTKRQVVLLLGSPSIDDPFHQDRWDYVSTYAPRGESLTRKRLTLRFEQDQLSSIEGDYLNSLNIAQRAIDDIKEEDAQPIMPDTEAAEGPFPVPDPTEGEGGG